MEIITNIFNYKYYLIIAIIAFVLVMLSVILFILSNRKKAKYRKQTIKKDRISLDDIKRIKATRAIVEVINDNANEDKKYKLETKAMQAGINLEYGEIKILSVVSAIVLPILVYMLMSSIYMAVGMIVVGFFLPTVIIKSKANKNVKKMNDQIGAFLRIINERYKNNREMGNCLNKCLSDFTGQEPFYSCLKQANLEISMNIPCEIVLDELARKSGNTYMKRFADYYKLAENLATHEMKIELMKQPFIQYMDDREIKLELKEQISGPVSESRIMICATPAFMIFQGITTEGYTDFMLHNELGQIGLAGIAFVVIACIIFTNVKIGGPIE